MKAQAGMGELMRQAARLQRKVERTKEEMKDRELSASAAGDKVKVTVSLGGRLRHVAIDPEFLASEGIELALDSVVAAANNALEAANAELDAEISKATGGLKIPGLG
jgi:nucleoid-associated protein EbfC